MKNKNFGQLLIQWYSILQTPIYVMFCWVTFYYFDKKLMTL